jgi:Transglutaminase-like superfamily
MVDLLRKFGQLSWRDRLLLIEAAIWLAIATLGAAVLPLRTFGGLTAVPNPHREKPQQTGARIGRDVCWAIVTCARRLPWRTGCLQKGIAAQIMLKRRGIPSVLHFDEAPRDGHALAAHIWTRDLNLHLINDEIDPHFASLAQFPSPDLADSKAGDFRQAAQFREDRGPQP